MYTTTGLRLRTRLLWLCCGMLLFALGSHANVHAQTTSEDQAFAALRGMAKAHGRTVSRELLSYTHFASSVIAHVPLDGVQAYTEENLQRGAPLMVLLVDEAKPSKLPNGTYLVVLQIAAGDSSGAALLLDERGQTVAKLPAYSREPEAITSLFPGSYDPPPPPSIPNINSTHVWHAGHWAVDCVFLHPFRILYY